MTNLLLLLGATAALTTVLGYIQSSKKQNSFGVTPWLYPFGIFVWGDAIVFGPFWVIVAFLGLLLQNVYFVYAIVAFFWFVRAHGEVMYWMHEQFATKHRNKPKDLLGHQLFSGDAVWFGYQTFWQCVMVFSGIASLVYLKLWLF